MEGVVLTDEDIADLNRMAIERSATFARYAGGGLVAVGAAGVLLWLWIVIRTQDRAESLIIFGTGGDTNDPAVADRLDVFANTFTPLVSASLVIGLGLLLRVAGEYFQTRAGGSVTRFRAGDVLDETNDDAPEDDIL